LYSHNTLSHWSTTFTLPQHSSCSQVTNMSQQQQYFQECSEIHTIQVFREADAIMVEEQKHQHPLPQQGPLAAPTSTMISMPSTSVPFLDVEVYGRKDAKGDDDGIGGDWAIEEMEEDVMIDAPPPPAERRGSDSTLYSFYFETPLLTTAMGPNQQQHLQDGMEENDDFTITSQDSESFHNTSDLQLDNLEDSTSFWETGLSATKIDPQQEAQRCMSPAHVSLQGEEQPSSNQPLSVSLPLRTSS